MKNYMLFWATILAHTWIWYSEGTTNKAVDDEVDSRVNDGSEVSNMSETTNNCVGSEIYAMVHAFKNIVNMENVGCNAQEWNWENIEPSLASMRRNKESLNRDSKCHEDTAIHSNVAQGVDEEGEGKRNTSNVGIYKEVLGGRSDIVVDKLFSHDLMGGQGAGRGDVKLSKRVDQ